MGWTESADAERTDPGGAWTRSGPSSLEQVVAQGEAPPLGVSQRLVFPHQLPVIARDAHEGGRSPGVVVAEEIASLDSEEEIIEWCRTGLARFKVPKQVEFRDELPKTMVGKILRRELMEEEAEKESAVKSA